MKRIQFAVAATLTLHAAASAAAGLRWFRSDNPLFGLFGNTDNCNPICSAALCFSAAQYLGSPCANLDATSRTDGTVPYVRDECVR